MQVLKTNKGVRYRERVYIEGKSFFSPRFERKTDAVKWKARLMSDRASFQATGIFPQSLNLEKSPTLSEFAETWLEARVKLRSSRRTYENYADVMKRHILSQFGNLRLNEIKLDHGDQLIKKLVKENHNASGINLILGIFKRVMIEATKEERITKNPFLHLNGLKEAPTSDAYLSSEEIKSILEISHGSIFHSLFLVAVNSGLRKGELAGLCWDKINFDLSLMEISRLRDRNGLCDRTKSVKSRRFIPMNAVVKFHLLELKAKSTSNFVFVTKDNEPFDTNHLYRDFRRYQSDLGIKDFYRFHDLRHSFASHFMMNGGNIYDLQKILGHSSLEMTQRYAHLAPEHLVQASNVVSFGASLQKRSFENRANTEPSSVVAF